MIGLALAALAALAYLGARETSVFAIRTIEVSKLTNDLYPKRLLRFDKFAVEQVDQDIAFPRVQRVLSQLNDRTAELRLM